jgi:hypothetical protein
VAVALMFIVDGFLGLAARLFRRTRPANRESVQRTI